MRTTEHSHFLHPVFALVITSTVIGCDPVDEPIAELDAIEASSVDALVDESRTVAQLPGFDLEITADEGDVVVLWGSQGGGGPTYTVWRGSEPYYEPGDPGSIAIAQGLTDTIFVDANADADDEPYYYRVQVEDGGGALSTTAGKYVHTLHTGYNKISQPLITDVADASTLSDEIPQMWSAFSWDAVAQSWQGWYSGADFEPFGFGLGDVPVVMPMWGTNATYHQYGVVPDVDELQLSLWAGDNVVTVPLSYGDTMASDLMATVTGVTSVGQWDNVAQQMRWFGATAVDEDFEVLAGSAVHLVVTADSVWPGP